MLREHNKRELYYLEVCDKMFAVYPTQRNREQL